jgi:predicted transcriptional regulator
MPIGLYTRVEPVPPCGLASATGIIGSIDHPQSFFLPERVDAEFLWNGRGYVEYAFPNQLPRGAELLRLELAMEIGSEIALHRIDIPSDITVWVNEAELGTWTSLGGLGSRRGHLTPDWWWDSRTQHGVLKVWAADARGCYVDGALVSERKAQEIPLEAGGSIVVRIGFRPDAANVGGFNLFGHRFGNYEQGILLRLHYLDLSGAATRGGHETAAAQAPR